jgi:hypothetical protein
MIPLKRILQRLTRLRVVAALAMATYFPSAQQSGTPSGRVIEVLADHDSRYKVSGTKEPLITVKPDEVLTLRVTAKKAKNSNREGFIHGFTLLRSKDRKPVAPQEPGEHVVICTVICSEDHEGMTLKLVVLP